MTASVYHFAAENRGLVTFAELIRGRLGYSVIGIAKCDLTDQVIAISWKDATGWNSIAFTEKGRRNLAAINDAFGADNRAA